MILLIDRDTLAGLEFLDGLVFCGKTSFTIRGSKTFFTWVFALDIIVQRQDENC